MLDAVIARKPDAILIAPTDKTQLVAAAEEGRRCRHPGHHRRHLHRHRQVPDRRRRRRLPALLHRLRQRPRRPDGGARARQGDRREGQGLRLQREARHLDHRPARGRLQGRDEETIPSIEVLETQFNDDDANKAASAAAGGLRPQPRPRRACSAPTSSPPSAPPTACSRPARPARSRSSPSTRRPRSSTTSRPASSTSRSPSIRPRSAITASCRPIAHLTGQSIPTAIGTGFTVIDKDNIADPERRQVHLLRLSQRSAPAGAAGAPRADIRPRAIRAGRVARGSPCHRPHRRRRDVTARRRPTTPTRHAPSSSASPTCAPGCSSPRLIVVFEVWARTDFGGTFVLNTFNLQSIAIFAVAPLLLATRPDLRHHLRRHRPVARLHHGPRRGRRRARHQRRSRPAAGSRGDARRLRRRRRRRLRPRHHQRPADLAPEGAALHRHARHVRRRPRHRLPARRRHHRAGVEQPGSP